MNDHLFRSSISIYQGMAVNFAYMLFRFVTVAQYRSVWFFSMAVYYLVLCMMKAYLVFNMMILSVINLIKFQKMSSPIMSAAKVLNFVSALMSALGLQTAMISRFSFEGGRIPENDESLTGSAVFATVMVTVIIMYIRSSKSKEVMEPDEKI